MVSQIINTTQDKTKQKDYIKKLVENLEVSNKPKKTNKNDDKRSDIWKNNEIARQKDKDNDLLEYLITILYTPGVEVLRKKVKQIRVNLFFSYPRKLQSYTNSSKKTKPSETPNKLEMSYKIYRRKETSHHRKN